MSVFLTRVPLIFGARSCLIPKAACSSISARVGYASQAALNEHRKSNPIQIKTAKKLEKQKADTSLKAVTRQVLSLGEKLMLKRHLERKAQKSSPS